MKNFYTLIFLIFMAFSISADELKNQLEREYQFYKQSWEIVIHVMVYIEL